MLKEYPKFKRGEIWKEYDKLPKQEQKFIEEYLTYRKARGKSREQDLRDLQRYIAQIRIIVGKDLRKLDLKELRELTALINTSKLSNEVKNNLKINLKNFLKYAFEDWSIRFKEFDDLKLNSKKNEEKINSSTIFSKEDIEKLMKFETKNFWKAFLITQYEAGLRTIETRSLKWSDIKFNVEEDLSEINIFATKTKKARTIFVKEATFYLKKLKEEQQNQGIKSVYCFPSPKNHNESISKNLVSMWFRALTKKALGREGWNYLLRHSRATELYRLAHENKISKDTAIKFMGHSADMSNTYTHLDKKSVKEMLKNQVYKLEDIPEEKKSDYEKRLELLEKQIAKMEKVIFVLEKKIK